MKTNMKEIQEKTGFLRLPYLKENLDSIIAWAFKNKPSYVTFLKRIIDYDYNLKKDKALIARIKRARLPEQYTIDTFPFEKQKKLDKCKVMTLYDSLDYINKNLTLLFVGPTGCGKSGLAISFLLHAIHEGYRGLHVDFQELLLLLGKAKGSFQEEKLIQKYIGYQILLIDEMGYSPCNEEKAGLFFDLFKKRYKNTTTIITTQYGFDEWNTFFNNEHMTAAIIDRITTNCALFNMKNCISIRDKNILYGTKKE